MIGEWMHIMDKEGLTPLDRAYQSNHLELAEFMLRVDRESHSESLEGSTPMHRAAMLGLAEAVRALLRFGSQASARDQHGETPLHKAAREGHLSTVALLARVSDVNLGNHLGMTPLHWAALAGRRDVAKVLLECGADPSMPNVALDGVTPGRLAELMGYEELADLLNRRTSFV